MASIGKAKAVAAQTPAQAIALAIGNADDIIRGQRIGPITVSGWSLGGSVGDKIFLDPSTDGAVTSTRPYEFAQTIGYKISTTSMLLRLHEPSPIHFGYTAAPDPPTGYPDGILYVQLATTTTTV